MICDCEGYEHVLLDPLGVDGLATTDFLVEFHDQLVPGVSASVASRFNDTHSVEWMSSAERTVDGYPILSGLSEREQQLAMTEFRHGPQLWGFFQSLIHPGTRNAADFLEASVPKA